MGHIRAANVASLPEAADMAESNEIYFKCHLFLQFMLLYKYLQQTLWPTLWTRHKKILWNILWNTSINHSWSKILRTVTHAGSSLLSFNTVTYLYYSCCWFCILGVDLILFCVLFSLVLRAYLRFFVCLRSFCVLLYIYSLSSMEMCCHS